MYLVTALCTTEAHVISHTAVGNPQYSPPASGYDSGGEGSALQCNTEEKNPAMLMTLYFLGKPSFLTFTLLFRLV